MTSPLNDDYDEVSFAHIMAIKELNSFLNMKNNENDGKDEVINSELLDQLSRDEIPQWISIDQSKDKNTAKSEQTYVHILTTKTLVEERRKYNFEQKRNVK